MTDILASWPGRPFLFSGSTETHDAHFWLHLHHTLTNATGSAAPRSPLLPCLHRSTVPPRLATLHGYLTLNMPSGPLLSST